MEKNDRLMNEMPDKSATQNETSAQELNELIQLARRLGASEVGIVNASQVPIEDHLANVCREIRCDAYGLSPSCPPHVSGPSGFRELIEKMCLVWLFGSIFLRRSCFQMSAEKLWDCFMKIVASVEQEAVRMGYAGSKAFAGGSCKKIFCWEHAECRVLSAQGECRNPQSARPSMSGFGINVLKLMQRPGSLRTRALPPPRPVTMEKSCPGLPVW